MAMIKKRFSAEQIVTVLKKGRRGLPVVDLIRKVGITEQNFYRRQKQYSGMGSVQIRELKQLSEENAKRLIEAWRIDCNVSRPHVDISNIPLREYVFKAGLLEKIQVQTPSDTNIEIG